MLWNECGCGFPWFGIVFFVIFLVILLFWILPGRRWHQRHHFERDQYHNSAEDIVAEKYAKGEITEKEFEEKLEVLRKYNNR
jgi:uncharacterized membrane protein